MKKRALSAAAAAIALLGTAASPAHALLFNLSFIPGTSAQEQASFTAAANIWSSVFNDPVTVKLTVGTGALAQGVLAQAGSRRINYSYTDVRNALGADSSTQTDAVAVSNLAAGSSVGLLMNRTSDNPNGAGSATPFLDNNGSANNSTVRLTAANARALGLGFGIGGVGGGCADCDAFIQFSTGFTWDHDGSNGIGATAFDFVGVAVHEIGHALGFVSGVDTLDSNAPPIGGTFSSNQFTFVSSLDLFRWSVASTALNVQDWTADNRDKCFSIDRGVTCGPLFSNGVNFGDGRQASHWKDNLGIGILDPTAARGELLGITANDLRALDVIGWNIPEPSTYALVALAVAGMAASRRRRLSGQ
jgi:PEP-CTERM motif